eukprot:315290-Chlamydomonas_euryale.AAC.3
MVVPTVPQSPPSEFMTAFGSGKPGNFLRPSPYLLPPTLHSGRVSIPPRHPAASTCCNDQLARPLTLAALLSQSCRKRTQFGYAGVCSGRQRWIRYHRGRHHRADVGLGESAETASHRAAHARLTPQARMRIVEQLSGCRTFHHPLSLQGWQQGRPCGCKDGCTDKGKDDCMDGSRAW